MLNSHKFLQRRQIAIDSLYSDLIHVYNSAHLDAYNENQTSLEENYRI